MFSKIMSANQSQYIAVEGLRVVLFGLQLSLIGLLADIGLPLVGLGVAVSLLGLLLPN